MEMHTELEMRGLRNQRRPRPGSWKRASRCLSIAASICFAFGLSCGVKRVVRITQAPHIAAAKTASLEQLLENIRGNADKVKSLSSNGIRLTFTSGKLESGKLQAYRSAPGYVLLKRPDFLRLNIQNPVTKTSIFELLSRSDDFFIWYPHDNRFFIGKNSTRNFDLDYAPSFSVRPVHMFEALMPPSLPPDMTGLRIALEEEQDQNEKYYVVSFFRDKDLRYIVPVQRFWIERYSLTISKELTFGASGEVESIIHYSGWSPVDGTILPLSIRLDRPRDGYSIEMQFRSWRLNPDLPDNAFVMEPPPGAERVFLKEKSVSE